MTRRWIVLAIALAACGDDAMPGVDALPPGSDVAMACGDGFVTGSERCDDGNLDDGDSCSRDCARSSCTVPFDHPTFAAALADPTCPTVYVAGGTYREAIELPAGAHVIQGVGFAPVMLDGEDARRVVHVPATAIGLLRNVTIARGRAEHGAGIWSEGDLYLEDVFVERCVAEGPDPIGGGLHATGALTLSNTHVRGNIVRTTATSGIARLRGGGIAAVGARFLLTNHSNVSDNAILVDDGVARAELHAFGGGVYTTSPLVQLRKSQVRSSRIDLAGSPIAHAAGGGMYAETTFASGELLELFDNRITLRATTRATGRGGGLALEGSGDLDQLVATSDQLDVDAPDALAQGGSVAHRGGRIDLPLARVSFGRARATSGIAEGGCVWTEAESFFQLDGATVQACTATATAGTARGGGVYADTTSGVLLLDSSLIGNTAEAPTAIGGALVGFAYDTLIDNDPLPDEVASSRIGITRSTIANNQAIGTTSASGGGVALVSNASVAPRIIATNSTVHGNAATGPDALGGGLASVPLASPGGIELYSVTITGNAAARGGGLAAGTAGAIVANTILSANTAPEGPACVTSGELELVMTTAIDDQAGCAIANPIAIVTTPPTLGPLTMNGGPTLTRMPLLGSSAIDAGDPAGCRGEDGFQLFQDQRGFSRFDGTPCDLGAVEREQFLDF